MNQPSLHQLFDRHHRAIFRFFVRSGAGAGAEDLMQDVFLRALRLAGSRHDDPLRDPRAWLFRIARNLWIDHLRQRRRRAPREAPADFDPDRADTASGPAQDLQLRLDQALAALPAGEREAFLLREVGGLGYVEIGEITGATPAAVRSRIFRARRELRSALTPANRERAATR